MDDFNWDVIINLAVKGAKGSQDAIKQVTAATDALNRSQKITPEQAEATSRALARQSRAAQDTAKATSSTVRAWQTAGREANTLLQAQNRLNAAQSAQSFAGQISGLNAVQQAQARLAQSTAAVQKAQAGVNAAKGGSLASQAAATQALTSATMQQTRAQQSLAVATQNATRANQANSQSLESARFANYDMARTLFTVSAAITGAGTAAVVTAAQYERAFANVARTTGATGEELKGLYTDMMQLTREIPQSFGDITSLASRGAQLGIASDQLKTFTETVAMFVATSDSVTLDQAVEAFGRISNLLNDGDFNAIGSSITKVGVNAAATEAQIVKTTQELAPFAAAVGLSTDETIGFSAALASLGQAPERSRSAFLTLQKVMDGAVAGMNDKLGAFANMLGMTSDEVSNLWKQDPSAFISQFVSALGSVENMTVAFADLGINERRAVQVFQALAADSRKAADGGVSVLTRALHDANTGYSEGTELQTQYAVILETLASKWQILINAVGEFASAMGSALLPMVTSTVEGFTTLFQILAGFANSGFGQFLTRAASGLGAVIAVWAALRGAVALSTAVMMGFQTVLRTTSGVGIVSGFRALVASIAGVAPAAGAGAVAMGVLRTAIMSTGIGVAVVALGALIGGIMDLATAEERATQRSQELGDSLQSAVSQDTAKYKETGQAIGVFNVELQKTTDTSKDAADAAKSYAGIQSELSGAVDGVTASLQEQSIAFGENTEAALRQKLAGEEGLKDIASSDILRQAGERLGFSFDEFMTAGLSSANGFKNYINGLTQKVAEEQARLQTLEAKASGAGNQELADSYRAQAEALSEFVTKIADIAGVSDGATEAIRRTAAGMEYSGAAAANAAQDVGELEDANSSLSDSFFEAERGALSMEDSLYRLGQTVGENSGMWDMFSEGGRENLGALYDAMETIAKQSPGDTGQISSNWTALYNSLIEGGVATVDQLSFMKAKIDELANSALAAGSIISSAGGLTATFSGGRKFNPFDVFTGGNAKKATVGVGTVLKPMTDMVKATAPITKAATVNFDNMFNGISSGASKAASGTRDAANDIKEEVRTLADYAGDLSSVLNRAFDLQFGASSSIDKITSQFLDMRRQAEETARSIRALKADILGIQNDINTQNYFLKIALEYGDTKRAEAIQANLAKLQADLADKTSSLNEEQQKNSRVLTGNTQSAIENRATMESLVKAYQDHIVSLASSGMSQADLAKKTEQLRQDFIRQATQLGFNRGEIEKYSRSFGEIAKVIAQVPRNITISTNAGAAATAIAEFAAKSKSNVQSLRNSIGGGVNVPVRTSYDGSGAAKAARAASLQAEMYQKLALIALNPLSAAWYIGRIAEIKNALNSGNYWTGGFTGRGGTYEAAGTVHRGEYVIPQRDVNQSTGLPYADALGRMMQGAPTRYDNNPSRSSASAGRQTVDLSASSIQQIGMVMDKTIQVGGQVIATTATTANETSNHGGSY